MLKRIRQMFERFNMFIGRKLLFLCRHSSGFPGDEFQEWDILVEIGNDARFIVSDNTINSYGIAFKDEFEDYAFGHGAVLPYFEFKVSKGNAHKDYVKVGHWNGKKGEVEDEL